VLALDPARRVRSRSLAIAGDLLLLLGVVFSIPLVILAIGLPVALLLQLLLWLGGLLR
jgi:hypothetical protein